MDVQRHLWQLRKLIASLLVLAGALFSYPQEIPQPLIPWHSWVLDAHPEVDCPTDGTTGDRLACVWLSTLAVNVETSESPSASFRIVGHAYTQSQVELPHAIARRPYSVQISHPDQGTKPGIVGLDREGGKPVVHVPKGAFVIDGMLRFETLPSVLNVPNAAISTLRLDDTDVHQPRIEDGKLWLSEPEQAQPAAHSVRIEVFRRLMDHIPQDLETTLKVIVEGNYRVINLGPVLPEGFRAYSIQSTFPVQVAENGDFHVQLGRGITEITISAISDSIQEEFHAVAASETWPDHEFWAFKPIEFNRSVAVSGVDPVDPNLVDSPYDEYSNYHVTATRPLRLIDEIRGDPSPKPGQLNLTRALWLGFDGQVFVAQDFLNAKVNYHTRISSSYPLGSVTVNDQERMVTAVDIDGQTESGIFLSDTVSLVDSISAIDGTRKLSATGWNVDADSLQIDLNLPPGWKLLWTSGVDQVAYSWLSQWWNLWDIFLAVLVVIVVYRVAGPLLAVLVSLTLLFSYQENLLPALGWLTLGSLVLLHRTLGRDRLVRTQNFVYWTVLIPVAFLSLYVAATNVRQAVYPQLEQPNFGRWNLAQSLGVEARSDGSFIARNNFDLPSPLHETETLDIQLAEEETLLVTGNIIDESELYPLTETLPLVQTGPGEPYWKWHRVKLNWVGPVTSDQQFSITLLPPWMTRLVYFAVAALHLIILLFFILVRTENRDVVPPWIRKVLPFLAISLFATSANAAFPDQDLLDELAERLLEPPTCAPACSSLQRVSITNTTADLLELELHYTVQADSGVLLPMSNYPTSLVSVDLRGEQLHMVRSSTGVVYLNVPAGSHVVTAKFELATLDQFVMDFPMAPAMMEADLCCWTKTTFVIGDEYQILFQRLKQEVESNQVDSIDIELVDVVELKRVLILDRTPKLVNKVFRYGPVRQELALRIPSLPGERVISRSVSASEGYVNLLMEPGVDRVDWESEISLHDSLKLSVPEDATWSETWAIRGSDFWHYEVSGLPYAYANSVTTNFRPRSGESLLINLSQPQVVAGQTLTIEHASLIVRPGLRSLNASLELDVTAGTSDELVVTLPDSSVLTGLTVDDVSKPIGTGNVANILVGRGSSSYKLEWTADTSMQTFYRTPEVSISSAVRNIDLSMHIPRNQWILLLSGPRMGAAVLFWGVVIVTVGVALAMTRLANFPLTKIDAVLVAIGATLANIWALLFVVFWLLAIWWRGRNALETLSNTNYRLAQLGIGLLTVLGVLALFTTVLSALLTPANMFVGPQSSPGMTFVSTISAGTLALSWYDDFSLGDLPRALVVSLPFWLYQLMMLGWSLWLVFALIRWIRQSFHVVSLPTYWRKESEYQPNTEPVSPQGTLEDTETPKPDPT